MVPAPTVLLGLRNDAEGVRLRGSLEGWVERCGYRPRWTADAREALTWLGEERAGFAASFLDAEMGRDEGELTWRVVGPLVRRRLVLVVRERRRDLWFEALRAGVATVLPFPPEEPMVRAALEAVMGQADERLFANEDTTPLEGTPPGGERDPT